MGCNPSFSQWRYVQLSNKRSTDHQPYNYALRKRFCHTKAKHDYPIIIGGGRGPGTRTLIKINANQQQLKLQMLDDVGKEVGTYSIR